MAWSEVGGTTQTLTAGGTPDVLDTETVAGDYRLTIDMSAFVNGDTGLITIATKVRTGGTSRVLAQYPFANIQANPNWMSPVIAVTTEIIVTVTQIAGTGRSITWSLYFEGFAGSSPPTAAAIADAVWDEDATAHQIGGTFGQAIGDPGASTETLYKAIVTDPAGINIAADVIAVKAVDDAVLVDTNELQTDWTNGGRLDLLIDAIKAITDELASAANAASAVWASAIRLLTAGTNIVLAKGTGVTGFNDPTVGAIADQVWDESIAGHVGAGSTGEALTNAGAAGVPPTVGAIADAVWDEAIAGHAGVGSTGEALTSAGGAGTPPTVAEIATEVYDQANGVEAGFSLRQAMRLMSSVLVGKMSGGGSTTNAFRDLTDNVTRVSAIVDEDGNRTAVTKDTS